MKVYQRKTGQYHPVKILRVSDGELNSLDKERYFFDWSSEKGQEVFKLCKVDTSNALGIISYERFDSEWRLHIRLLAVSKENMGETKIFEGIAGNMIAYTAKIAIKDYGEMACVSLKPKTKLIKHYISTYNMRKRGNLLSLEVPEIIHLVNTYDNK